MKEFIKKPENWGRTLEVKTSEVKALKDEAVNTNRARIEAKIAEIKAKLQK